MMISEKTICSQRTALHRYARALSGNAATADDVVQDALAKALVSRAQFRDGTSPRAWLFAIVRSVFIDHIRRTRRLGQPIDPDSWPAAEIAVGPSQETSLELRDFERAFRSLSMKHQEVLLLIGLEGLCYEEAADALRISVGTIKSRLFRARDALREAMHEGQQPKDAPRPKAATAHTYAA